MVKTWQNAVLKLQWSKTPFIKKELYSIREPDNNENFLKRRLQPNIK